MAGAFSIRRAGGVVHPSAAGDQDRVGLRLLKAELEAAEKEAGRIARYKNVLDDLTAYEDLAKDHFERGRGTEHAVLKVRARRLEVEIQLEQARMAGDAPAGP
jgi:hypothetical protein